MASLQRVTDEHATVLGNLFQFFCHDLAAVDAPAPIAEGRYVLALLSVYWTHPGMESFLILDGKSPVGFIVVTTPPHFMDVHCVQHLFVLTGHRRKGVAGAAV